MSKIFGIKKSKRWVAICLLVVLTLAMGCKKEDDMAYLTVADVSEVIDQKSTISIYIADEANQKIATKEVEIEQLKANDLLQLWVKENQQILQQSSLSVNSIAITQLDVERVIDIQLNDAFVQLFQDASAEKEYLIMGSFVNTFLAAYDSDKVRITCEKANLELVQKKYGDYLYLYKSSYEEEKIEDTKKLQYDVTSVQQEDGELRLIYPKIIDHSKKEIETKVNEVIEKRIDTIISENNYSTVGLEFEIANIENELLSLVFYGEGYGDEMAYPVRFCYTYNFDMLTGEVLTLEDLMPIEDAVEMMRFGLGYEMEKPMIEKEDFSQYIEMNKPEGMLEELKQFDFREQDTQEQPLGYSYQSGEDIYLVVLVPHALGDYVQVKLNR